MERKKNKKFKYVYYVVQTHPIFKVCGHGFSKQQAEAVSRFVHQVTGYPGKIIEFSRDEIKKLNYQRIKNV